MTDDTSTAAVNKLAEYCKHTSNGVADILLNIDMSCGLVAIPKDGA